MKANFVNSLVDQMHDLTVERVGASSIENAQRNNADIINGSSVLELKDCMDLPQSDTAIVLAAGPSLHKKDTAAMIKESGFNGIIIATESSMAWCLRHQIIPHIVVTVDPHPSRIVRWFGDPELTARSIEQDDYYKRQEMDPNFRVDQITMNDELVKQVNKYGHQIKIAIASSASAAVVRRTIEAGMEQFWWNPFIDDYDKPNSLTRKLYELNGLPCLNAGGNVGTACWVFAHAILNKTKIALLGMDMGYYSETSYYETQYYDVISELVEKDEVEKFFVAIKNPYLDQEFFTDPAYMWYRNIFLEMAINAKSCGITTYNCTDGGILFGEGIEFINFDKFISLSKNKEV